MKSLKLLKTDRRCIRSYQPFRVQTDSKVERHTPTEISKVAQRGKASIMHILVMYPRTALSGTYELFWILALGTNKQLCTLKTCMILYKFKNPKKAREELKKLVWEGLREKELLSTTAAIAPPLLL